jgi:hypothetical protein
MIKWGIDASSRRYRISGASAASVELKSNDKRSWSCEFNWRLWCPLELFGVFIVAVVGVGGLVVRERAVEMKLQTNDGFVSSITLK